MKWKANWDGVGIVTSVACAIHCAVLPLIVSSLPLFGLNLIHHPLFEWSMIGLALLIGTYSLSHGYRRHHRQLMPVWMFAAGAGFLVAKQLFREQETLFLLIAVTLIIYAHYTNYRLCHRAKCSSAHHKH